MPVEKQPVNARQGERGKSMLWVMVISTGAAVVIALAAYFYVFAEEKEELQGDLPLRQEAPETAN